MKILRSVLLLLVSAFLFLASGCVTTEPPPPNSIAGNRMIPRLELTDYLGAEAWEKLRLAPYDAYVIFEGSMTDSEVKVRQVTKSFPDHSRDELAKEIAMGLGGNFYTRGSKIPPRISIYVIFYETSQDSKFAIAFTKEEYGAATMREAGDDVPPYFRLYTY